MIITNESVNRSHVEDLLSYCRIHGVHGEIFAESFDENLPGSVYYTNKNRLAIMAVEFDQRLSKEKFLKQNLLTDVIDAVGKEYSKNKFYLGMNDETLLSEYKDFSYNSNALFAGSIASGKSESMNTSALMWMLNHMGHTKLFIVSNNTSEHKALLERSSGKSLLPQVSSVPSNEKLISLIEDLYEELILRQQHCKDKGVSSVGELDEKLTTLLTLIDGFESISYGVLDFDRDYKTINAPAYKFHQLMRQGRAFGIWFMATSKRVTKSDIPPEIMPNFTNILAFKMSRAESSYLLGTTQASEIGVEQKGRCVTEEGFRSFPLIPIEKQIELINKYKKDLVSKCLLSNLN